MPFEGGPTACDARLERSRRTTSGATVAPLTARTDARASAPPNGVTALKMLFARPSQKFRRLKTALMTLGALRDVACRTLTPPSENDPSSPSLASSAALPYTTVTNVRLTIPAEPTTSRRLRVSAEVLSFGLVNA